MWFWLLISQLCYFILFILHLKDRIRWILRWWVLFPRKMIQFCKCFIFPFRNIIIINLGGLFYDLSYAIGRIWLPSNDWNSCSWYDVLCSGMALLYLSCRKLAHLFGARFDSRRVLLTNYNHNHKGLDRNDLDMTVV